MRRLAIGPMALGTAGVSVLALVLVSVVALGLDAAQARSRRSDTFSEKAGVPDLNVRGSCSDAQKFSSGTDKKIAFNGCLQDELNAKAELGKRWSTFKGKDRSNCVEQARFPSPSYVEVLTCLEMSSDSMRMAPRFGAQPEAAAGGQPAPKVGGDVAPGLSKPVPGAPNPAK